MMKQPVSEAVEERGNPVKHTNKQIAYPAIQPQSLGPLLLPKLQQIARGNDLSHR